MNKPLNIIPVIDVFNRVKAVFNNEYTGKRKSFREGFRTCFELFHIGYLKTPRYNLEAEVIILRDKLERKKNELVETTKQLEKKKNAISQLNEELLKVKGDLMETKSALRESNDDSFVESIQNTLSQLRKDLANEKKKTTKILDLLGANFAAPEKVLRMEQMMTAWGYIIQSRRQRKSKAEQKRLNDEKLNSFVKKEAAKAENNIAA